MGRKNKIIEDTVKNWIELAKVEDYKAIMIDTAEKSYTGEYLEKNRKLYNVLGMLGKNATFDRFIIQAMKLNPRYLSMIVPSKWMVGGRGLAAFREQMVNDKRLRLLYDYEDANTCFPGVHIDGGVSYFLWDRDYVGKTEHFFYSKDGTISKCFHFLKNQYFDYVIRDSRIVTILEKIGFSDGRFSDIVSTTKPYGIRKYLFNWS